MVENAALRAIRLLDLVPYIVSHPGISIAELAKEFAISRDEVLKDLNLLFLCGLPGYTPLELIDISFDEEWDEILYRSESNGTALKEALWYCDSLIVEEPRDLRSSILASLEQVAKSHG